MGANSFLNEMTKVYMGDNNENVRVASPEIVPVHTKCKLANDSVWSYTAMFAQTCIP